MVTWEWNWRQYRELDTLLWEWNTEIENFPLRGPWQTSNILFCVHFTTLPVNTNGMASSSWMMYGWWIRRNFKKTVLDESKYYPRTCLERQWNHEGSKDSHWLDHATNQTLPEYMSRSYRYFNCSVEQVINGSRMWYC